MTIRSAASFGISAGTPSRDDTVTVRRDVFCGQSSNGRPIRYGQSDARTLRVPAQVPCKRSELVGPSVLVWAPRSERLYPVQL